MSDTMLLGVLRMPVDLWTDSDLDKHQRYSRYLEAADRIERDAELISNIELFLKEGIRRALRPLELDEERLIDIVREVMEYNDNQAKNI